MTGLQAMTATRMAAAMLASYHRSSRHFFKAQQRTVLLVGFVLVPLATIPEALFSPLLMLGDPELGTAGRGLGLVVQFVLWSAWIASQRRFVPSIQDMAALELLLSSLSKVLCVAVRYAIFSWPAFLLLACLQRFHDGSGRAGGAQLALCAVVVASCAMTEWSERRLRRRRVAKSVRSSNASLLVMKYAFSGITSWSDPRVPYLHACGLMALVITHFIISGLDSSSGMVAVPLMGTISAMVPSRALVNLATQRTKDECPLILACPRYHLVEIYGVGIAAIALFAATMTLYVCVPAWDGRTAFAASSAAALVSLLLVAFVLCRIVKVRRAIEDVMLCVFALIGVVMEFV